LFSVGGSPAFGGTPVKHLPFMVLGSYPIPLETWKGTVPDRQFDWGSHLLKSNTSSQRYPKPGWKSGGSCKGIRVLDCETDRSSFRCKNRDADAERLRWGAKAGFSDPPTRSGCGRGLKDKSYPGDNRLVAPERPQRRRGSAPRCRLTVSWGWRSPQGLDCSPIKTVRELGSERKLHCVLLQ